jgi:hypothetical protein
LLYGVSILKNVYSSLDFIRILYFLNPPSPLTPLPPGERGITSFSVRAPLPLRERGIHASAKDAGVRFTHLSQHSVYFTSAFSLQNYFLFNS